jgi:hypothetical protein
MGVLVSKRCGQAAGIPISLHDNNFTLLHCLQTNSPAWSVHFTCSHPPDAQPLSYGLSLKPGSLTELVADCSYSLTPPLFPITSLQTATTPDLDKPCIHNSTTYLCVRTPWTTFVLVVLTYMTCRCRTPINYIARTYGRNVIRFHGVTRWMIWPWLSDLKKKSIKTQISMHRHGVQDYVKDQEWIEAPCLNSPPYMCQSLICFASGYASCFCLLLPPIKNECRWFNINFILNCTKSSGTYFWSEGVGLYFRISIPCNLIFSLTASVWSLSHLSKIVISTLSRYTYIFILKYIYIHAYLNKFGSINLGRRE